MDDILQPLIVILVGGLFSPLLTQIAGIPPFWGKKDSFAEYFNGLLS